MKKKIINILIILIFTAATFYILFTNKELDKLPNLLKRTDRINLSISILLMAIYLLLNGLIILIIANSIECGLRYRNAFFLGMVGQYYSLITPFASGGQPVQIYLMKKKYDIPYSKGTSITLQKGMVYQVIVTLFALFMYFTQYKLISTKQNSLLAFINIGLFTNIVGAIVIILLAYNSNFIKKVVNWSVFLLNKLGLFRKLKKEELNNSIDTYSQNLQEMKKNKAMLVKLSITTFLQITCFFSITYFIYLSLGYKSATYIQILAIQTILYVVVSFIPTPGSAGASESGFYLMFSIFFEKSVLLYAMILWRIIVFYGNLILSGMILLVDSFRMRLKEAKKPV